MKSIPRMFNFIFLFHSFTRTDAALVNMSGWIVGPGREDDAEFLDPFLPKYFRTRRAFHIRHGVFRAKLGKKDELNIFEVFDW